MSPATLRSLAFSSSAQLPPTTSLVSDIGPQARSRAAAGVWSTAAAKGITGISHPDMTTNTIMIIPYQVSAMLPPMGGLLLAWSGGGGPASHTDWTSDGLKLPPSCP